MGFRKLWMDSGQESLRLDSLDGLDIIIVRSLKHVRCIA
jgi:hypothetical protein